MFHGINRNIVECKSIERNVLSPVSSVLIETLWNVNRGCVGLPKYSLLRINRNIVECKYLAQSELFIGYIVLIETLWNVNWINLNRYPAKRWY